MPKKNVLQVLSYMFHIDAQRQVWILSFAPDKAHSHFTQRACKISSTWSLDGSRIPCERSDRISDRALLHWSECIPLCEEKCKICHTV